MSDDCTNHSTSKLRDPQEMLLSMLLCGMGLHFVGKYSWNRKKEATRSLEHFDIPWNSEYWNI